MCIDIRRDSTQPSAVIRDMLNEYINIRDLRAMLQPGDIIERHGVETRLPFTATGGIAALLSTKQAEARWTSASFL